MKMIYIIGFLFFVLQTYSQDLDFNKTRIEPYIQAEINKDNNTIYCASFQIAWNNLCDSIIKKDIVLDKAPQYLKYLNSNDSKGIIDSKHLLVRTGLSNPKIIQEINAELQYRFNKSFSLPYEIGETDMVTFSFFSKQIDFYSPLNDEFDKDEILRFKNKKVDFFGLKYGWANPTYKKQLRIHDYKSDDDFIFQIATKDNKDEIYFAKVEPKETLEKTYNYVMDRVRLDSISYLEELDQVRIPYINLKSTKHFTEIEGKRLLNKGFDTYLFRQAVQLIDFNLTEKGISLESLAYGDAYECIATAQKKLIFDEPFLLIIKQQDSDKPYFLMWISNTELMKVL